MTTWSRRSPLAPADAAPPGVRRRHPRLHLGRSRAPAAGRGHVVAARRPGLGPRCIYGADRGGAAARRRRPGLPRLRRRHRRVALAGFALPYAFAGGALLLGDAEVLGGVVPNIQWLGSSAVARRLRRHAAVRRPRRGRCRPRHAHLHRRRRGRPVRRPRRTARILRRRRSRRDRASPSWSAASACFPCWRSDSARSRSRRSPCLAAPSRRRSPPTRTTKPQLGGHARPDPRLRRR